MPFFSLSSNSLTILKLNRGLNLFDAGLAVLIFTGLDLFHEFTFTSFTFGLVKCDFGLSGLVVKIERDFFGFGDFTWFFISLISSVQLEVSNSFRLIISSISFTLPRLTMELKVALSQSFLLIVLNSK